MSLDAVSQFHDALTRAGITPPPSIVGDGRLHRFATNGRKDDDSGWYVLHTDGIPAGAFGDWRTGIEERWHASLDRDLSATELAAIRERVDAARHEREQADARRHAEAAARARKLWANGTPAPATHPYLSRKKVAPNGLRIQRGPLEIRGQDCNGWLLMPLTDGDGLISSLEFIGPDGDKLFLPGGRVSGSSFSIGDATGVICVAEGFATAAAVHEATRNLTVAAASASNLSPVAKLMRSKYPDATLVIAADNDESGTGEREAKRAAEAVGGRVAVPPNSGTDWNDVFVHSGAHVVRGAFATAVPAGEPFVSSVGSSHTHSQKLGVWPAPTPLPEGLPPVAKFEGEMLPDVLRDYVADIADRMQCPPDFPAVAVIVTLSSAIGRRCGIKPKRLDDWTVVPNLWGAVVGRPGIMKSPPLQEVMHPLRALEAKAVEEHNAAMSDYEAGEIMAAESEKVARDGIRRALKSKQQSKAAELAESAVQAHRERPTCKRYVVNDATVEKLGELLKENPRGLLHFRDELTGFFRTLERQGHEADRAFYLECWNGDGSHTYDRIGRGTVHIPAACLSILGGIQPGPLTELVRDMRGTGDDGLVQRFQIAVWPDASRSWTNVDRRPDLEARSRIESLIRWLDALTPEQLGADPMTIPVLRFESTAQGLFDQWREILELRLRDGSEHPAIEAHLSKYRSLVPSLALILHLAESNVGPVSAIALERAISWAEYLETHARRIYAPAISPDIDAARLLADRIAGGDVGNRFALRDVYRNCWSGLATSEAVESAARVLEDFDWIRARREDTAGRARTVYEINPALLAAQEAA